MIGLAPRPIAAAGLTVKIGADVTWYGATGDGVTDDSAAIQRACDAAHNSNIPLYFPPGYTYLIGTAANPFADGLGGIKLYSGMLVYGGGRASLIKKAAGNAANYVFRLANIAHVEIRDLAIDMACDNNFQVGIYTQYVTDLYVHDCLITNSVIPGGANWTIMGLLAYFTNDIRWVNNRTVRCQVKLSTSGDKNLVMNNASIGAFNQAFSWVFQGDARNSSLMCCNNYIEGPADSGIFFGQDTGVTAGTFTDVLISGNLINGFNLNRGILGRYGSSNANWNIIGNQIRGSGSLATTIASQTANTFTVQTGVGASFPASGWMWMELGTVREESVNYTRVGDVFTVDHNFEYTHANGSEVWGLTLATVNNTLGIDIQCANDNLGGPMTGIKINDNDIRNVDTGGINLAAPSLLKEWQICNNTLINTRGIVLASANSSNLWAGGVIGNNTIEGFRGIQIDSQGGNHEANGIVIITGNSLRGDGNATNNGNGLVVGATAGTVAYRAIGNTITNYAGFAADGCGIKETGAGTIHHDIQANDLTGNTQNTLTGSGIVRNNKGYVTEAKGTGSILSGTTSVVITHGLSVTPTVQDIVITPSALSTTDPGEIYVTTITSTQFTVNCRTNPGASNLPFGWRAAVL